MEKKVTSSGLFEFREKWKGSVGDLVLKPIGAWHVALQGPVRSSAYLPTLKRGGPSSPHGAGQSYDGTQPRSSQRTSGTRDLPNRYNNFPLPETTPGRCQDFGDGIAAELPALSSDLQRDSFARRILFSLWANCKENGCKSELNATPGE